MNILSFIGISANIRPFVTHLIRRGQRRPALIRFRSCYYCRQRVFHSKIALIFLVLFHKNYSIIYHSRIHLLDLWKCSSWILYNSEISRFYFLHHVPRNWGCFKFLDRIILSELLSLIRITKPTIQNHVNYNVIKWESQCVIFKIKHTCIYNIL